MSQSLSSLQQSVPSDIRELLLHQMKSWQQGTRLPIETIIVKARPEVRTVAACVLIKQEIALREQAGEVPRLDEYLSRFPECADSLPGEMEVEREATMMTMATDIGEVRSEIGRDLHDQSYDRTHAEPVMQPDSALFDRVDRGSKSDSRLLNSDQDSDSGPTRSRVPKQSDPFSRMIGMYRLDKKLGQGGMGAVFRAVHTKLDKVVAIKVMSRQGTLDDTAVERFEREMRAVGRIEHPNVVRAMDAGEADGFHFLVMEYIEGQDVSQLVKKNGPFTVGQACEIIRQAALGLHEAHAMGLVHRDIKPSNLFLTTKGVVKILDLGLARLSQGQTANLELTQSGLCMGTPDYMAPEQWVNARDVDGRSDFYALGCTLYHLIVGHPPFGTKEHMSLGNKVLAHTSGIVPDVRLLCADFPEPLKPILDRMLAKERDKRFSSGAEMAAALQPFCMPLPGSENVSASEVAVMPAWNGNSNGGRGVRRWLASPAFWGGTFAFLSVTAFIIIKITDPSGRVTEVKVPAGSSINVSHVDAEAETASSKLLVKAAKPTGDKATGSKLLGNDATEANSSGKNSTATSAGDKSLVAKTGTDAATVGDVGSSTGEKPTGADAKVASLTPDTALNGGKVDTNPKMEKGDATASGAVKPMLTAETTDPSTPDSPKPMPAPAVTVVAVNTPDDSMPPVPKIIPAVTLKLPATASTIADQQAAWSRELKRPTTKSNSLGMPLILIPPGEFDMGGLVAEPTAEGGNSAAAVPNCGPRHRVRISRPFAISQYEITIGQFRKFVVATHYKTLAERVTATGSSLSEGLVDKQRVRLPTFSWQFAGDLPLEEEQPVTNISWYDAVAFCEWLSQKEGVDYRLPTEAEWEYIARAGTATTADGSKEWLTLVQQEANIADVTGLRAFSEAGVIAAGAEWDDSFATQAPVGRLAPNTLGVQDLTGNVAEWCSDRFSSDYYKSSPLENPRGPLTGSTRSVRGGSWTSAVDECRPEYRKSAAPRQAQWNVGFRVVQELPIEASKAPRTAADRELAIADWVIQAGGKVRVSINGAAANETTSRRDLPKVAPGSTYALYSVSLAETGISDLGLSRLKYCAGLQELDISGNPITDAGLVELAPHRMLKRLNLSHTHVTGAGLIQLGANKKITDLDLSYCPVSDSSLSPLKGLTTVTVLKLDSTAVTDQTLELIKPLAGLKELSLVDTRVTGTGLVHLKRMTDLSVLDLSETPLVNKSLLGLADLKALRTLRLNWSTVGDMGLVHIQEAYTLTEVALRGTEAADFNIDTFKKLKAIKKLDLRETDFSESGVGDLKRALNRATIPASIGDVNARVASLCLSLGGKIVIASDSDGESRPIQNLDDLPTSRFVIREIDLSDSLVSNGVLLMVPKLKDLKVLNLNGTRIDDAGVALLSSIPNLETLKLSGTLISEQALSQLAEMKNLKTLAISENRVPVDKVAELRGKLAEVQIQ